VSEPLTAPFGGPGRPGDDGMHPGGQRAPSRGTGGLVLYALVWAGGLAATLAGWLVTRADATAGLAVLVTAGLAGLALLTLALLGLDSGTRWRAFATAAAVLALPVLTGGAVAGYALGAAEQVAEDVAEVTGPGPGSPAGSERDPATDPNYGRGNTIYDSCVDAPGDDTICDTYLEGS
jgi:hypothetical protein